MLVDTVCGICSCVMCSSESLCIIDIDFFLLSNGGLNDKLKGIFKSPDRNGWYSCQCSRV